MGGLASSGGFYPAEIGRDKSGKCVAKRHFAFLRTLPGGLSAPSNEDLTQIADCDINGRRQINLTVRNIVGAVVTELK